MRLHKRHLIGTAISSVPYLAIAIGLAVLGHSPRSFTAVDVVALVTFCVIIRLEYRVGVGSAVAGQLVFVPLLFMMPLHLIPLAVCIGSVLGTAILWTTGQKPTLCPNAFGTSWFTLPPVLLLMAAGEKPFAWHSWPLYALALLLQTLADLVPAAIYERVVNATQLRPLVGVLATVYGFDVLLTPVGMLAAAEGGFAFLALIPFMAVLWLLSRERENRLQAESLAHVDDLTGGANRRSFDERLAVEQARASRSGGELSICMIDLDHFKVFNDTFGHPAGDELLKRVTGLWAGTLRPESLLARLGGEEFGLILPDASPDAAELIVERLQSVTPKEVTFSAGIATWDGRESLIEVVARADAALYRAKSEGRDRFVLTV